MLAYNIKGLPYNDRVPYLISCAHNFVRKNPITNEIERPVSVVF